MVDQNKAPGWGCNDFKIDRDLFLLNGEIECEHFWGCCCYLPGRENYMAECPYWIEPRMDSDNDGEIETWADR